MKKIFLSLFILSILFMGCEKKMSTDDLSRITYYVTFAFSDANGKSELGHDKVVIQKGTTYNVNENFVAMEGDEDVSSQATITGTVDGNTAGYYPVVYSAVNADGYNAGGTKGIFVADPAITTDISGTYTANVFRTPTGSSYTGHTIHVSKVVDGVFYVDRMLGSYYYDGFGYSAFGSYYVHGYIVLNADNSISYGGDSYSPGWGDKLGGDGLSYGAYDPATGVLTWGAIYAGGRTFNVTATPN